MRHRTGPSSLLSRLAVAAIAATMSISLGASPARASHYSITEVPTLVGGADAEKLQKAGVATTEDLLTKAATAKDRKALAKAAGISGSALSNLARRCDLLRIKGIGPEMVLLLEASGVKTTAELAKKDPAALETATTKANKEKKISEKPPTGPQFADWIEQAKKLPAVFQP